MGLLYQKEVVKRAAKAKPKIIIGKPSAAHKAARDADTYRRLGCNGCTLNTAPVTTPKMPPTLAAKTLVYFLAEAPGEHEDVRTGRPLTGPRGAIVRSCIPDILVDYCSFDNCIRDRPEADRSPTWQEIECCRNHVIKSIEQTKPLLIIGLGAVPLSWMMGTVDITVMRGRMFAVKVGGHACWFTATFDPKRIIETAFNRRQPLLSKMGHCLRMDIERALKEVADG